MSDILTSCGELCLLWFRLDEQDKSESPITGLLLVKIVDAAQIVGRVAIALVIGTGNVLAPYASD